jgi:hypothetical protein
MIREEQWITRYTGNLEKPDDWHTYLAFKA